MPHVIDSQPPNPRHAGRMCCETRIPERPSMAQWGWASDQDTLEQDLLRNLLELRQRFLLPHGLQPNERGIGPCLRPRL